MAPHSCFVVRCFLALILSAALSLKADIVYDNSRDGGVEVYYSLLEHGDEIMLGGTLFDLGFYSGQSASRPLNATATTLTGYDRVRHVAPGIDVVFKLRVDSNPYVITIPRSSSDGNTVLSGLVSNLNDALRRAGVPSSVTATEAAGSKISLVDSAGGALSLERERTWMLTEFLFEYYGEFAPNANQFARLRFYQNDGPGTYKEPGTLLFDSGDFSIAPGFQTKRISGLSVVVPDSLTWTVQFTGLSGQTGNRAGLVFRATPTVGWSYDDFWQRSGGDWQMLAWNGSPVANFAARALSGDAPITVYIEREGSRVVVMWPGDFTLQAAADLGGTFIDIPEAKNRWVFDTRNSQMQYWRLRR
jgi:hypothetical protein